MKGAMDTTAVRSEWAGRVVDERFALLKWLGGSGSSGAFLTELQEDRSQKAVVKLTPVDAAGAESLTASWEAAAGLSHPHLMRLLHTGRCEIDGVELFYSVTEYADEVLSNIVVERPLTPDEAKEMLVSVLDALSYLHQKGFVHGHVKPSNIMVVEDQLKLSVDCVHVAGKHFRHSSQTGVHDAPEYESGMISPAADVWSLGVTLVEALTQRPPDWDRSGRVGPSVPVDLLQPFADIAQRCLRLDPAQRCTLSEVKTRLNPFGLISDATTDGIDRDRNEDGARAGKFRNAAIVVVGLLVVIAVVLIRLHHAEPSDPNQNKPVIPNQPREVATPPSDQPVVATSPAPAVSPQTSRDNSTAGVVKGSVVEQVEPKVSAGAKASIQGTVHVKIRVAVDSGGKVLNATYDSHGPSKYFAEVAEQAARHWTFKPAQVSGHPAASEWVLQFQFRQSGTEVTPVETSP
jgi:serine/threonine protein kinase